MQRRELLQRGCQAGLAAALSSLASSCGAIIYPERVGQPRGRLDPSIVILDGLGLLLFLVPGLIAFAVDFATGAIYLPPEYMGRSSRGMLDQSGLVRLQRDPGRLTREEVETAVTELAGHAVRLEPGSYQAVRIESLDEFRGTEIRLAAVERPPATEVVFRGQSPR